MGGLWTTPPVPPALYLSAFQKIDGRRGGVSEFYADFRKSVIRIFEKRRHLWGLEKASSRFGKGIYMP